MYNNAFLLLQCLANVVYFMKFWVILVKVVEPYWVLTSRRFYCVKVNGFVTFSDN